MIGYRILILEDEVNLGMTLYEYLHSLGYICELTKTIQEAQAVLASGTFQPQICLLDIGLPDGCGLELGKQIKSKYRDTVIFFLSAQNDPETRLIGFEIGADDYINKPFNLKELTLRLERTVGKLSNRSQLPSEINHGKLKIWFNRYELEDGKAQKLQLSQKECAILELLYQRQNQAVARHEMIDSIWGKDSYPSNRTIDNYIVKLRKWCESDPLKSLEIQSIRGVGYKLNVHP
jgi:two-component system alkaline phosphatase synthesis response regulator PhoP